MSSPNLSLFRALSRVARSCLSEPYPRIGAHSEQYQPEMLKYVAALTIHEMDRKDEHEKG